jgi:hypothetical protein
MTEFYKFYIVLLNSAGCELDRFGFKDRADTNDVMTRWLAGTSVEPGDTIRIEEDES